MKLTIKFELGNFTLHPSIAILIHENLFFFSLRSWRLGGSLKKFMKKTNRQDAKDAKE
ncbi:hypothetical protein [Nostoc sp. CHAB 5715]|uniref:hypothetical protein n=1 Tax=Nostoc sp. CHAB 5715 TaxID=2780400 RepID=UPI001E35ADC9|nr:hypothetical protein [Nostoc sp. CHAB 5715]MCC5620321.1 hypothetical protein [Nostoc sp. CHAB 5715]